MSDSVPAIPAEPPSERAKPLRHVELREAPAELRGDAANDNEVPRE